MLGVVVVSRAQLTIYIIIIMFSGKKKKKFHFFIIEKKLTKQQRLKKKKKKYPLNLSMFHLFVDVLLSMLFTCTYCLISI